MDRHIAAVIGSPVRRSFSPLIFRHFRKEMKRRLEYFAVTVEPHRLPSAMESARRRPWTGWNVTMPHKVSIIPLLDRLDPTAQSVGAVNVVHFSDRGAVGYNTDVEGFLAPLDRIGFDPKGRKAVLIGSGGAARAVCCALRRRDIANISVISRTFANIASLEKDFGALPCASDLRNVRKEVGEADLVVNATPLGSDGLTSPIRPGVGWKAGALAYDLVYRPLETPFLRHARQCGAQTLGGLGMLVAQAAETWRIWFGESISQEVSDHVEDHLRRIFS